MSQQLTVEDYCKHRIAEAGTYRAVPVARTVEKYDSGAVAIAWKFAIVSRWHGKEHGWSEQYALGWYSDNRTFIVKKDRTDEKGNKIGDGELSEGAIKNLKTCGLWDGDWDKLDDASPIPSVYVLVDIEKEEYQGQDTFRVNWINPDAAEPKPRGQFAPVDKGLLASLRMKHQAKTRALVGGAGPAGAPPPPPGLPGPAAVPPATAAPAPGFPTPSPSLPGPAGAGPSTPPPWGGSAPTAQPVRPPGAPAPTGGLPPAVDPGKPPF